MITDIASIVFVCVAANHLGLVSSIEEVIGRSLPIINCVKCSSFWLALFYCFTTGTGIIDVLAISFLCSWAALWLEVGMGYIDILYINVYEKIIVGTADDASPTNAAEGSAESTMSELRKTDGSPH